MPGTAIWVFPTGCAEEASRSATTRREDAFLLPIGVGEIVVGEEILFTPAPATPSPSTSECTRMSTRPPRSTSGRRGRRTGARACRFVTKSTSVQRTPLGTAVRAVYKDDGRHSAREPGGDSPPPRATAGSARRCASRRRRWRSGGRPAASPSWGDAGGDAAIESAIAVSMACSSRIAASSFWARATSACSFGGGRAARCAGRTSRRGRRGRRRRAAARVAAERHGVCSGGGDRRHREVAVHLRAALEAESDAVRRLEQVGGGARRHDRILLVVGVLPTRPASTPPASAVRPRRAMR